jgi:hypothetical protein
MTPQDTERLIARADALAENYAADAAATERQLVATPILGPSLALTLAILQRNKDTAELLAQLSQALTEAQGEG